MCIMDLASYIQLGSLDLLGLASWAFVVALAAKVASTAAGLWLRARAVAPTATPGALWWVSKLSAVAVCGSAALLCQLAQDARGRVLFSGLGVVAVGLVVAMAWRRASVPSAARAAVHPTD